MLVIKNIRKAYHNHLAIDDVSFEVPKGVIFGLLGPNGAGKTSLIRVITGITHPDEGEVYLAQDEIKGTNHSSIGYMPEERGLYKKMKVGEQLVYLTQLKGLDRATAKKNVLMWMDKFEIRSWWNKRIDELSKGMQQKIQFISTVAHEPKLMILDEPFSGLDPINTNLIKNEIRLLKEKGTSIIFSTHRMEQVEEICEYIVLINDGRNVLEGHVDDIKEQYKEHLFRVEYKGNFDDVMLDEFEIIEHNPGLILLKFKDTSPNVILSKLMDKGIEIKSFQEVLPTLNEIFIKLISSLENG